MRSNRVLPFRGQLTTPQVREAIRLLEGDALPQRTLAGWQAQGIVSPSVRWDRVRGSAHACVWSLDDLVRVRLVVRLRRAGGLSMMRVRALLAAYEAELRAAMRPDSRTVIVVDRRLGVALRDRDSLDERDMETGQYRLPLSALFRDAERVMVKVMAACWRRTATAWTAPIAVTSTTPARAASASPSTRQSRRCRRGRQARRRIPRLPPPSRQ